MTLVNSVADRAAGAVLGALIGDALGLGCHWYYDRAEMRRDCGEWISDYLTPKEGRYHAGMRPGQLSQSGLIIVMLMESVLESGGYVEADFIHRLDEELMAQIDGTAMGGPGGYTNQSIREAYQRRVVEGKPWGEIGGQADTTEAAERCVALSALYARQPGQAAVASTANCRLTQVNEMVVSMSAAFNCALAMLVGGEPLDVQLTDKLLAKARRLELPFNDHPQLPPPPGDLLLPAGGPFAVPDSLLIPSSVAEVVHEPGISIEPAWKAAIVYGLPCPIYNQLPAAYYLAARFPQDFESAVLHAINGGGQNMSRACLTGALVGAQVGLARLPERFIAGLENSGELVAMAKRLGALAEGHPPVKG